MKRRTFIHLSAFAATLAIPSLWSFKPDETVKNVLRKPLFLSQICSLNILHEIGTRYKSLAPLEVDSVQLTELLLTDKGKRRFQSSDPVELSDFIERKINYDLSTGNTVIVNGWVISRTEARQCALLSLN